MFKDSQKQTMHYHLNESGCKQNRSRVTMHQRVPLRHKSKTIYRQPNCTESVPNLYCNYYMLKHFSVSLIFISILHRLSWIQNGWKCRIV